MWAVTNHTPYAAGRTWGRDKNGLHEWIVAVKATFDIKANGELVLAEKQLPPLLAPEYNGDDGVSSLRYEADLVGTKPATDVVLNGTAYATCPGWAFAHPFRDPKGTHGGRRPHQPALRGVVLGAGIRLAALRQEGEPSRRLSSSAGSPDAARPRRDAS